MSETFQSEYSVLETQLFNMAIACHKLSHALSVQVSGYSLHCNTVETFEKDPCDIPIEEFKQDVDRCFKWAMEALQDLCKTLQLATDLLLSATEKLQSKIITHINTDNLAVAENCNYYPIEIKRLEKNYPALYKKDLERILTIGNWTQKYDKAVEKYNQDVLKNETVKLCKIQELQERLELEEERRKKNK